MNIIKFFFTVVCLLVFCLGCNDESSSLLHEEENRSQLISKRDQANELLVKYEVDKIISLSQNPEDYAGVSVPEIEKFIATYITENKAQINAQKLELKREEDMYDKTPEYLEKIRSASSEKERMKIRKEYQEILNISGLPLDSTTN